MQLLGEEFSCYLSRSGSMAACGDFDTNTKLSLRGLHVIHVTYGNKLHCKWFKLWGRLKLHWWHWASFIHSLFKSGNCMDPQEHEVYTNVKAAVGLHEIYNTFQVDRHNMR